MSETSRVQAAVSALRLPVALLTGAGLSTDSGIPDYRGPGSPMRTPMTYQEFISGPRAQRRYWARAHVGWARMSDAAPNPGHLACASLESAGASCGLITQNVDGLHIEAGSRDLVELHGRIRDVICLSCAHVSSRALLHARLAGLNPGWAEREAQYAPDGDALIEDTDDFVLAACLRCGGALKPDVVFFGENVPKTRVERSYGMVAAASSLLVAGSSLQVMSGLRFVRAAAKAGIPVVIVNRGRTRGDDLATITVDAGCSEVLPIMAATLSG